MTISTKKIKRSKTLFLSIVLSITAIIAVFAANDGFFLADGVTFVETEPELIPEHAFIGAFEGGPTGTKADAAIEIAVPEEVQLGGGGYNIPTGSAPSPLLYGATAFSQKMLRFEEFGPQNLPAEPNIVRGLLSASS